MVHRVQRTVVERHTLSLRHDVLDEYEELSETNNLWGEQWGWIPSSIPLDTPVLRTPAFALDRVEPGLRRWGSGQSDFLVVNFQLADFRAFDAGVLRAGNVEDRRKATLSR